MKMKNFFKSYHHMDSGVFRVSRFMNLPMCIWGYSMKKFQKF